MRHLIVGIVFMLSTTAYGAQVTWVLEDVVLSDGQTLEGSFVFDTSAPEFYGFSAVSITNSGNETYAAMTFDTAAATRNNDLRNVFTTGATATGKMFLQLDWLGDLADGTGTFDLNTYPSGFYSYAFGICDSTGCGSRTFYAGSPRYVSGTIRAVPIPPAILLFASACGALIARRRTSSGY